MFSNSHAHGSDPGTLSAIDTRRSERDGLLASVVAAEWYAPRPSDAYAASASVAVHVLTVLLPRNECALAVPLRWLSWQGHVVSRGSHAESTWRRG